MIHPEVLPLVNAEFKRLVRKNPKTDGAVLWKLAASFIRETSLVETWIILRQLSAAKQD